MARFYPRARGMLAALALTATALAFAGNIPQYRFSRSGDSYAEFSDGTAIPCTWGEGTVVIYPDGYETPNEYSGKGFPIGFDFRFGGRTVDQFAVSSVGQLFLGNGSVHYRGDAFTLGMTPVTKGISSADISYRTTGTSGNRVFTLQFKNAVLRETTVIKGKYSLQIRLYEADGRVEMAFNELETTYDGNGFDTGLHGWDTADGIQLTATGINPSLDVTVSSKTASNILERDSYITWDEDDYDHYYKFTYVFTPVSDTTAPAKAPALSAEQNESTLNISATRADGADATVVLVSPEPFTTSDMPVDGETFRAGVKFGNATTLYYGNSETIEVDYSGLKASSTYYVRALSVNGYPAYNRTNPAEVVVTTTQAAPSALTVTPASTTSISFNVSADDSVIVAATTEKIPTYQAGYAGTFGTPSANAKAGDEISGGGKVVYVGQPGTATVSCDANQMVYLRAWTVKNGVLSATSTDAAGVPTPSFPYEPGIENYPTGVALQGWTATDNQFIPIPRAYKGDLAVVARTGINESGNQVEVYLTSPALPLSTASKLTFDFAMETARDAAETDDSSVAIPQGNMPGVFGDTGYLRIYGGNILYKTVNTYSGSMTSAGSGTYEDGSSTFETVEVDMGEVGSNGHITFRFAVPSFSSLYIKNIRIEQTGEAPTAPANAPSALAVDEDRAGTLYLTATKGADATHTLVLFSGSAMTSSELPEDGKAYTVGSKVGSAMVLYYGTDDNVACNTNLNLAGVSTIITDYDTDYHFRAISSNANPLYNREKVADITYRTMPDMEYPKNLAVTPEGNTILVEADRASKAAGTILLLSEGSQFSGTLVDGTAYKVGDKVGNATVVYTGTDSHISTSAVADYSRTYYVTGYSYNSKGWYGDVSRSASTATSGVETIASDGIDFSTAEVYTITGIRLNVASADELPAGIYIINGCKVAVTK